MTQPPTYANEGERQLAMLEALDRLKGVIRKSIRTTIACASDGECDMAALLTMVSMVEDGRLQVYLAPEKEGT